MKKSITRTPQSEEDAYETYRYIALDSVEAAEAYFDALFDTFDKLLEHPKMGAVVEEAKGELHGLRLIPVSSKFRKHLLYAKQLLTRKQTSLLSNKNNKKAGNDWLPAMNGYEASVKNPG